jgi:ubiquinone/menaquinone biosynthesis C-methylase UbiE
MNESDQTKKTKAFFEAAAAEWSSRYDRNDSMAARRSRFSDALQIHFPEPADILDFGCGSGDIARHLSAHGHRVTGCDLSVSMIQQAKAADAQGTINWLAVEETSPQSNLPFDNSSFDAVISSSVLEYVDAVDATLAEFGRVLKPGGWLLATVPDMRSSLRRREVWLRRAALIPVLSTILEHSRWREGAGYQRISINRWPAQKWHHILRAAGLEPAPVPDCTDPLVLLSARKPKAS